MADNLDLWRLVEKTDPSQTKPITGKPYRGTSPKPYFLIHEATKVFGPCGLGWGFTIVSERVEAGGRPGDKVHIAHVRVWYTWDGKRGEVEHIGETMFAGTNKNGLYSDEDAPKKSVTDALVKALSMIGFAGDIFMGRYDDSKYVNGLSDEFRDREAQSTPDAPFEAAEFREQSAAPSMTARLVAAEKRLMEAAKVSDDKVRMVYSSLDPDLKIPLKTRAAALIKGKVAGNA